MSKLSSLYIIAFVTILFSSCASSYNVHGSSSLADTDGRMLYLKQVANNEITNIDSCDVLHGQFTFTGTLDTIKMVNLYVGEQYVIPFVLEEGPITINLTSAQQKASGTPLNDKLFKFISHKMQLQNQMEELSHRETQAIMNGEDVEGLREELLKKAQLIEAQLDELETQFIVDNCDNILGPSIFQLKCSEFRYPMLTPQIEEIISRASKKFKEDPFVSEYYRTANNNMHLMQGYDVQDLDNLPSK